MRGRLVSHNRLPACEARLLLGPGAAGSAAAQRIDGHLELIAGLERLAGPAFAHQRARTCALEMPNRRAAVAPLHLQQDESMRARELELLHGAGELHRVLLIEHREGMMRPGDAARGHEACADGEPQQLTFHRYPPLNAE